MKIGDVVICIQNDSISIPIDEFSYYESKPILKVGNIYIINEISRNEVRVKGYIEFFHKGLFKTLKTIRKEKLKKIL